MVAALTMPSLIAKYQEKVTVTKLKKFYSVMSQAYAQSVEEYGTPDGWDLIAYDSPVGAQNMAEKFKPYLKITDGDVGSNNKYFYYNLSDGSFVTFTVRSASCSQVRGPGNLSQVCGTLGINFHGKNEAGIPGTNEFYLIVTKNGIIPHGTAEATGADSFEQGCLKASTKNTCTAWVLYNENMDYLHCDDLSWGGKTKCD
jgi:hypothetical protein